MLLAWRETWPLVNVGLIAFHILLLCYGVWLIRVKNAHHAHTVTMLAAGIVFLVFLTSFLVRVFTLGLTPLGEWDAPIQPRHLQTVHAAIALVTVVVVAQTYRLAIQERYPQHRRIAYWGFGLWVFTGLFGIAGHFLYPR